MKFILLISLLTGCGKDCVIDNTATTTVDGEQIKCTDYARTDCGYTLDDCTDGQLYDCVDNVTFTCEEI